MQSVSQCQSVKDSVACLVHEQAEQGVEMKELPLAPAEETVIDPESLALLQGPPAPPYTPRYFPRIGPFLRELLWPPAPPRAGRP